LKSQFPKDLPATSGVRLFLNIRLKQAERFLEIAQQISAIQTTELLELNTSFSGTRKRLKVDLKNLEQMLRPPLDSLHSSISGYDKYFKQLQLQLVNPQQARRAVDSLDEKLGRVQNYYAEFHRKFVEYCAAREPIFQHIESAVNAVNASLEEAILKVARIDGVVVASLGETALEPEAPKPARDLWDEEEEANEPKPPFYVRLTQTVTAGALSLTREDRLVLIEAVGNKWKVQDATGKIWTVPQTSLNPEAKA
jgi:post-segregation antitoxin (ccd killing protein)